MLAFWILVAALMLLNLVYCAASIRNDASTGRRGWAAIGILGVMGAVISFWALEIASRAAMADMLSTALKDF